MAYAEQSCADEYKTIAYLALTDYFLPFGHTAQFSRRFECCYKFVGRFAILRQYLTKRLRCLMVGKHTLNVGAKLYKIRLPAKGPDTF